MPENTEILEKDIREQIEELKEADILVGVPSYNNARTIVHVVKAVEAGLSKYFPEHKSVLVNSDGGSLSFGLGGKDIARRYLEGKVTGEPKEKDDLTHV